MYDKGAVRAVTAALLALGAGLLAGCGGPYAADITVACEDAVRAQTRNPDTVDFKTWSSDVDSNGVATGEFTAENDFGAKQSFSYSCTMTAGVADATIYRR